MKMEPGQAIAVGGGAAALEALAAALRRLAEGGAAEDALQEIAEAAATGAGADLALVWIRGERSLEVRIVTAASTSVAAELQGSRVADAGTTEEGRSIGRRLGLAASMEFPIAVAGHDPGRPQLRRPAGDVLGALTTFAARATHARRSGERAREQAVELERSRTLIAVVGQAIAELSLAHTLETAIDRVAELLGAERLAVYLLEPDGQR